MKFWSNSDIAGVSPTVPEKKLLAAVMQRAITDFLTGDGDLRDGAFEWLFQDEPKDAPLTFLFICEALDLDHHGLRNAILGHDAAAAAERGVVREQVEHRRVAIQ